MKNRVDQHVVIVTLLGKGINKKEICFLQERKTSKVRHKNDKPWRCHITVNFKPG